jgi:hypothetical protein
LKEKLGSTLSKTWGVRRSSIFIISIAQRPRTTHCYKRKGSPKEISNKCTAVRRLQGTLTPTSSTSISSKPNGPMELWTMFVMDDAAITVYNEKIHLIQRIRTKIWWRSEALTECLPFWLRILVPVVLVTQTDNKTQIGQIHFERSLQVSAPTYTTVIGCADLTICEESLISIVYLEAAQTHIPQKNALESSESLDRSTIS